jgi:hypothetical protein
MYVNPFWMGVLLTIVAEIIACIVYAIVQNSKGGKR